MLYFQYCALCRSSCRGALCTPCRDDLQHLALVGPCPQCATPSNGALCGKCLQTRPAFDRTYATFLYGKPLSGLICDFKFNGRWQLATALAAFLQPPAADILLPVPLFPMRERWRGFNQARELARNMPPADRPDTPRLLTRTTDTSPQSLMTSAAARRRNVRGAFRVDGSVRGKTVMVLDDVMSSGATLNEIAKVLKQAGASMVINLVIARAAA